MYCLFCSESVVSAAMFRIYGTDVAELPLVATSADCQGQVSVVLLSTLLWMCGMLGCDLFSPDLCRDTSRPYFHVLRGFLRFYL